MVGLIGAMNRDLIFRFTRCCMHDTTERAVHQFNLGWKLALVEKGLAHKSLLEIYNVIFEMLEMTTSIHN